MDLTERAQLILDIARRIKAEKAAGRSVDPSRLEWAEQIMLATTPAKLPGHQSRKGRATRAHELSGAGR